MGTRAVVLDVGGVLARDMWEPMFADLAREHGADGAALHRAGLLLWETFAYVRETPENTGRHMERRYWELFLLISRLPLTVEDLIALTDRYVIPVPGMHPILESLKARGTPLLICSNNNEIWWERQVQALGLRRFFTEERTILSSRVGASKGSPGMEMFRAVVAAAGVPPGDCFFVDDRQPYVDRAREFGIDATLFRGAAHYAAELRKRGL